ncbi:AAA family ATPase [Pseudonocardia sp. CA-142604]|uniref:helix-turn-helix transcriptional regulator n=1 Tax=Pseudonocardia sp. CA-142604 TaxID=3240024 RepID=UPI003D9050D8
MLENPDLCREYPRDGRDEVLRGRRGECRTLARLLQAVQAGESRVLMVRGEPGVGKTALLDRVVEQASGCAVVQAVGVQAETGLDFAGLHQLCGPMTDRMDRLPARQRESLEAAFGRNGAPAPDRFLVALAVMSLLVEASQERPLVCVVDDVQWLDRASVQVLAFVARRLSAAPVGMVFAARTPGEVGGLADLPELTLTGLPAEDARALLVSALVGPIDERVLDRIVAETRGNPRALLQLPQRVSPTDLAGGFGLPDAIAVPAEIEHGVRRQLAQLAHDERRLVLLAAAEPVGDPILVRRAAELLGIDADGAGAAAELVEFGARVRFRHPLVRSAVSRVASRGERRGAHRALAAATDAETDPGGRAWHEGHSVTGRDDDVATDLEQAASGAQDRGGLAAAAAFLERAAELTREPARRAERALCAAQATYEAGAPGRAVKLLSLAEAGQLDKLQRARVDLVHAQIDVTTRRDDAPLLLLDAARQLEPIDVRLAREAYLEALSSAALLSTPTAGTSVRTVAKAARGVPDSAHPARATDLLLDGLAIRFTEGYAAAIPTLNRALDAFRDPNLADPEALRQLGLAGATAAHLWDDGAWHALVARHVRLARDSGALAALPLALDARITQHVLAGELTSAHTKLAELNAISRATGNQLTALGGMLLAGWQGRGSESLELIEDTAMQCQLRDKRSGLAVAAWAKAVLFNSLGRYDDALEAIEQAGEHTPAMGLSSSGLLAERVVAAARSGAPELAADALERLTATTRASGTNWALGIEARCRALLATGPVAEHFYREAIDRLGRTRIPGELARAHLLFGEWLRRERRRLDAREHLRTAHAMFTTIGAEGFAQRTRRELAATGETARKQTAETSGELTAHEVQIACFVRQGLTNPEIAGRLYLSPRTVEWHVSRIFDKLNIRSRKQLRNLAQ